MPFNKEYREWLIRVVNNRCQYRYYTEENGWQICGRPVDHIHHIIPEGWQLKNGTDPEHEFPGLPLCRRHHVGR